MLIDSLRASPGQTLDELISNTRLSRGTVAKDLRELLSSGRLEKRVVEGRIRNYLTEAGLDPLERLTSKIKTMSEEAVEDSLLEDLKASLTPEMVKVVSDFCTVTIGDGTIPRIEGRVVDPLHPSTLNVFFADFAAETEDYPHFLKTQEDVKKAIEDRKKLWMGDRQAMYNKWEERLSRMARDLAVKVSGDDLRFQFWDEGLFSKVVQDNEEYMRDLAGEFTVFALLSKHGVASTHADKACKVWLTFLKSMPSLALDFMFLYRETHRVKGAKCFLAHQFLFQAFGQAELDRSHELGKRFEEVSNQIIGRANLVRDAREVESG